MPATNLGPISSEIRLSVPNGNGSINTKVRRWTNITSNSGGSNMSIAQSATLGDIITINTAGTYSISFSNPVRNSTFWLAIGVNVTQLTTNIESSTDNGYRAVGYDAAGNTMGHCSWTGPLNVGDKVYFLVDDGGTSGQAAVLQIASIARVN